MIKARDMPLVIKQREIVDVRLNRQTVAQREEMILQIQTQSLADVRSALRAITIQETDKQIRIKNFPSRVVVDNREGRPIDMARRRIEVTFGSGLDQLMIKALENAVKQSLRYQVARVLKHSSVLTDAEADGLRGLMGGAAWEWRYTEGRGKRATKVNPYRLGSIPAGAMLVYSPKNKYAAFANMLAARMDAGWSPRDMRFRRGRSGGRGFMRKGVEKVRRSRLLKNFDITVAASRKFLVSREIYHPGTGSKRTPKTSFHIIIRARRRTRTYRRR